MNLENLNMLELSSPWVSFCREIDALFGEDPEIRVEYDEASYEVKLFVDNEEKADALMALLPEERVFGRVILKISVIPANIGKSVSSSIFQAAFSGNPVFSYIQDVSGVFSNPISYVVFKNKVVQYFNDDLGDINGNCSTLYQEIAKDVFGEYDGIFFCTDAEGNPGKPVSEWY